LKPFDADVSLNVSNLGIDTLIAENSFLPGDPLRREIDHDTQDGDAAIASEFVQLNSKAPVRDEGNKKR
jgi:hypothetical protein